MASSTSKDNSKDSTKESTKDNKDSKDNQGKDKKDDDDRGRHRLDEYKHYHCKYKWSDQCQGETSVNNAACAMCLVSYLSYHNPLRKGTLTDTSFSGRWTGSLIKRDCCSLARL